MQKREGQNTHFLEKYSLPIIFILSILATSIIAIIVVILVTPKPTAPSNPTTEESSIDPSTQTEKRETAAKELNTIIASDNPAATAEEFIPKYTEALQSPDSSTEDKITTSIQLAYAYKTQKKYDSAISTIKDALNIPDLSPDQQLQLRSTLNYLYGSTDYLEDRIENLKSLLLLLENNPNIENREVLQTNYTNKLKRLTNE